MDINLFYRPYDVKKVLLVVLIGLAMISIITVILSFGFIKLAEKQPKSTCKNFFADCCIMSRFQFLSFYSRHKGSGHYWSWSQSIKFIG